MPAPGHATRRTIRPGDPRFIHIAPAGCGSLHSLGAENVVAFDDWLAWGPCDVEPETHAMLRKQFWGRNDFGGGVATLDANEVRTTLTGEVARVGGDAAVVTWTSAAWSDRLRLLWLMDGALRHLDPAIDTWIVDAPSSRAGRVYQRKSEPRSLAEWPVNLLGSEWPKRRRLGRSEIDCGHSLWRLFAARDPLAFDAERRRGFPGMPALRTAAEAYRLLFPRLVGRRIHLSAFDHAILSPLVEDDRPGWHRVSSLVTRLTFSEEVAALGSERAVWERLWTWARDSAALDLRREPRRGVREELCCSFRITDVGRRLVSEGLSNGLDAPVFFSGGCRLYGGSPWAVRDGGSGWRVVQI